MTLAVGSDSMSSDLTSCLKSSYFLSFFLCIPVLSFSFWFFKKLFFRTQLLLVLNPEWRAAADALIPSTSHRELTKPLSPPLISALNKLCKLALHRAELSRVQEWKDVLSISLRGCVCWRAVGRVKNIIVITSRSNSMETNQSSSSVQKLRCTVGKWDPCWMHQSLKGRTVCHMTWNHLKNTCWCRTSTQHKTA